ncbi:A disintegrin and metalloproteinase with thrombospondin motifs adt-2-like [Ruditapes philippinarum]|uniref:A disintegrin and metalloproteinase with thrombospondin motifs adt-2-like n=1 Tax=Ruditapes philippinarum TaxID=129788 RepID=UPI00295BECF3|nr:A disintegrin and metalloproteinase with thrombospondin motifs adt-2-like [Ruditapes philippinarum]
MLVQCFTMFIFVSTISGTASLSCFTCSDALSLGECTSIETCSEGEVCYKKREYTSQVQFSLGCIDKKTCGRFAEIQNTSEVTVQKMSADKSYCQECCSTNKCNKDICTYPPNSECKDSKHVDCAQLNSMFSICEVKNEAKKICPRFCDLCNLVDGGWSSWSQWSSCDVTCGNGLLLRQRTCNNPTPQNGGLDCPGNKIEKKSCSLQLCPVHGGWSSWGKWGTCSATCDTGMRRRIRSCTKPRPERFGNHCFGNNDEAELCKVGLCTKKVAFDAYTTSSNGYYPDGKVLVFPHININDGQGYNPSTGIFKAPVAGVYQFTAHVCQQGNRHIIIGIMKGTKQIAVTTGFEKATSVCSSISAISRVEVNEKVYVKARYSDSYLQSDIYRWPSFSGILMYS